MYLIARGTRTPVALGTNGRQCQHGSIVRLQRSLCDRLLEPEFEGPFRPGAVVH